MKKNLVKLIQDNPGCVVLMDNDWWRLYSAAEYAKLENDEAAYWLAHSDDEFEPMEGVTWGNDNLYGQGVLRALAMIVGVRLDCV